MKERSFCSPGFRRLNLELSTMETKLANTKSKTKLALAASKLATLLHRDYVELAFNLPRSSHTIWNYLLDDINKNAEMEDSLFTEDEQSVLAFLAHFFSVGIVSMVEERLPLLEGSFLGLAYTFRLGKAAFAHAIVNQIILSSVSNEEPTLHEFMGICAKARFQRL